MCDRIRDIERLIAAARASGLGVAYCFITFLQVPVEEECKYKANHYAVFFVTYDFVVNCEHDS